MNHTDFGSLIPSRERFIQKFFSGSGIFLSHGFFDLASQGANFAADIAIGYGMRIGLTMRFKRRRMTTGFQLCHDNLQGLGKIRVGKRQADVASRRPNCYC